MIFDRAEWCDEAAEKILPLVSAGTHEAFEKNVRSGCYVLWRVRGSNFQTWLVTSVDDIDNGKKQLNLECIAGERAREIVEELKRRVRPLGVARIRFETIHPEKIAQRFVGPLGFEREATVFRCEL